MNISRRPYYPKPDSATLATQAFGALMLFVLLTTMIVSAQLYFRHHETTTSRIDDSPVIGQSAAVHIPR